MNTRLMLWWEKSWPTRCLEGSATSCASGLCQCLWLWPWCLAHSGTLSASPMWNMPCTTTGPQQHGQLHEGPQVPLPRRHLCLISRCVSGGCLIHTPTSQDVISGLLATAQHAMHQERTGPRECTTLSDRHDRWVPGVDLPQVKTWGCWTCRWLAVAMTTRLCATAIFTWNVWSWSWWVAHWNHQEW